MTKEGREWSSSLRQLFGVTKKGREVSKEWKMIKEEEVGCPEEVESGEECYRNSLWVKGERLIFITNERCVTFDEDLN